MFRGLKFSLSLAAIVTGLDSAVATAQQFETGPYSDEQSYFNERYTKAVYVGTRNSIGLIRAVELRINDQVGGNCWTNADAIKARFRVELERSNIAVYVEPLAVPSAFTPVVDLTVGGFRMASGVCAATATASVQYLGDVQLGSLGHTGGVISVEGYHTLWQNTTILTKGGDLDAPLMEQCQEWIDTLIADISEARRDAKVQQALKMWPSRPPTTEREFQAQIEKVLKQSK